MTPKTILAAAAQLFDVAPAALTGPGRERYIVAARHAAAYALRQRIPVLSLSEIGRLLGGRDRTTVIWALAQVERNIQSDAWYAGQVQRLLVATEAHQEVPS